MNVRMLGVGIRYRIKHDLSDQREKIDKLNDKLKL